MVKQVIAKEQRLKGKNVNVGLPIRETNSQTQKFVASKNKHGTILVSNLPEEITANGVYIHFQKKKNKGGEIREVKLQPNTKEAMVVFEDIEGLF